MKVRSLGFTMIELLVVITIMAILASVTTLNIRINLIKSRDSARKSDLVTIQKALELYVNDNGVYPLAINGKIGIAGSGLVWGEAFESADGSTIYMNKLPKDPRANPDYCYLTNGSRNAYQVYANLENSKDARCITVGCASTIECGSDLYNYGVSSSNLSADTPMVLPTAVPTSPS